MVPVNRRVEGADHVLIEAACSREDGLLADAQVGLDVGLVEEPRVLEVVDRHRFLLPPRLVARDVHGRSVPPLHRRQILSGGQGDILRFASWGPGADSGKVDMSFFDFNVGPFGGQLTLNFEPQAVLTLVNIG